MAYLLLSQQNSIAKMNRADPPRRRSMKADETELDKPSFWQLVFAQSKVNGAHYIGEQLPGSNWNWPKETFLQRRLRQVKWHPASLTPSRIAP